MASPHLSASSGVESKLCTTTESDEPDCCCHYGVGGTSSSAHLHEAKGSGTQILEFLVPKMA